MRFWTRAVVGVVAAFFVAWGLCAQSQRSPVGAFAKVDDERLENVHVVTEKVISGAEPEGPAGFEALREMGVKTIISVDGAKPDVETARKYGIRYVHLPITYSTVTPEQGKAIAKAIDELPGPVYVHCHHGKHRSAAAVAVACVYNGSLAPQRAESVLRTFGTGENYKGLWKAAREARPVGSAELRGLDVKFVETTPVPPLAEAMILLDRHADHLKEIQKAGWRAPADHPDLDPAHEALQLEEHLHEIGRGEQVKGRPEEFRRQLIESEGASRALRAALAGKPVDGVTADVALKRVTESCTECHKAFRD
jgi:protein tyrosine phosphatase (PTP) superfamily phosphohydrolase (DUF442 family)